MIPSSRHILFVNSVCRDYYFFFICDTIIELRCDKRFIKSHPASAIILRSASLHKSQVLWSKVSLWSNFDQTLLLSYFTTCIIHIRVIVFIKTLAFVLSNKGQLPALLCIRLSLYHANNVLKASLWYRFIVHLLKRFEYW